MGIYLNPGNTLLDDDRHNPYYIDKSMIIRELNHMIDIRDKLVCVSRPRRFGKTMAANMLAAYYSKGCDSHEVFKGLKITDDPSFEEHINNYNVIMIDCGDMYSNKPDGWTTARMINECVIPEFIKAYPELEFPKECNLARAINTVHSYTNEKFVIVMDEYDKPIREQDTADLPSYLKLLKMKSVRVYASSFINDPAILRIKDDVLTYLIHLGYLTYDEDTGTCRIPNGEAARIWKLAKDTLSL